MDSILMLVEQGHAARSMAGIKVRQPLAEMKVVLSERGLEERMKPFLPLVLDELNIKAVDFTDSVSGLCKVFARLDARKGKPKHGRLFAPLQKALESESVDFVESSLAAKGMITVHLDGREIHLSSEEVIVEKKAVDGWALSEGNGMIVLIDTRLDDALIREGLVRDLVRHIQKLRKDKGFDVTDRIRLEFVSSYEITTAISAHREYISAETLAASIERVDNAEPTYSVRLGGEEIKIDISRE
jgi:isoleucyl-tRNA synthetase